MSVSNRLKHVVESSKEISLRDSSRFIIMSDCHRGDGSWADNFLKNQNLFLFALTYYYNNGYTYIELGDGDELWENRKLTNIYQTYKDIFQILSRFYKSNRLYMIYGNHDAVKKNNDWVKHNYWNMPEIDRTIPMFPNIHIYESLLLRYIHTDHTILLLHGHQGDFINDRLWKLSRFLVRYVWKPLEMIGFHNPTSASNNSAKKESVENKLLKWSNHEKQLLIAGHTHHSIFTGADNSYYFNDGCCVHQHCITGIEIADGEICLIKWSLKVRNSGTVYVGRDIIAEPKKLKDCFNLNIPHSIHKEQLYH